MADTTTAGSVTKAMEPAPDSFRERARRLAAMLRARPERHQQSTWGAPAPQNECGTTACVGGWGAYWRAGIIAIDADGTLTWDSSMPPSSVHPLRDGEWYSDAGRQFLGLAGEAADVLFYDTDDEQALAVLDAIADGRLGPASDYDDVLDVRDAVTGPEGRARRQDQPGGLSTT